MVHDAVRPSLARGLATGRSHSIGPESLHNSGLILRRPLERSRRQPGPVSGSVRTAESGPAQHKPTTLGRPQDRLDGLKRPPNCDVPPRKDVVAMISVERLANGAQMCIQ
jgi:hypothetical protein